MLSITVTLPITEEEAATLRSILDGGPALVQANATAPAVKAAAPKAGPKAKAPEPVAEVEPEPEPEPEEDLMGTTPVLQDAVDQAMALVNAGKTDAVKAALKSVGAAKVGALKPNQVAPFIAALNG